MGQAAIMTRREEIDRLRRLNVLLRAVLGPELRSTRPTGPAETSIESSGPASTSRCSARDHLTFRRMRSILHRQGYPVADDSWDS
jgi:hypothetical protein